jgi:hypothetical protein
MSENLHISFAAVMHLPEDYVTTHCSTTATTDSINIPNSSGLNPMTHNT